MKLIVCFYLNLLSIFSLIISINSYTTTTSPASCTCMPESFYFLHDIDATILEDIRYYSPHNFMGRRVEGYNFPGCILTLEAIQALTLVQKDALQQGYTLKVYDCYRPQRAVDDFVAWGNNSMDILTKKEFYPTIDKPNLFPDYIATQSGHSRGSTLDLTLVKLPVIEQEVYLPGQQLVPCFANVDERFKDNSIDMNTGFDCLNKFAHTKNVKPNSIQSQNRQLLVNLMSKYGFINYEDEWWHYTLQNEPYPTTYFDFPIQKSC